MFQLNRVRSTAAAALVVLLGGCSNPVSSEDHDRPNTVVISDGTTELVRVVHGSPATGSITVTAGQQSPLLTVRFLRADGSEAVPGNEYHLRATPVNAAIATWQPTASGAFTGRVAGIAAGSTTINFDWFHGRPGSGHSDLAAPLPVPVAVVP